MAGEDGIRELVRRVHPDDLTDRPDGEDAADALEAFAERWRRCNRELADAFAEAFAPRTPHVDALAEAMRRGRPARLRREAQAERVLLLDPGATARERNGGPTDG